MQTDFLSKPLNYSLHELKKAIEDFEKHQSPNNSIAEELHNAITQTNKLVSAYLVLNEHKEISSEREAHPKTTQVVSDVNVIEFEKVKIEVPVENIEESKVVLEPIQTPQIEPLVVEKVSFPKLNININDKFRFINELFSGNANEYQMAIEQLNTTTNIHEANVFLNGLKDIYAWKDDNELVKNLMSLVAKRF
jgi:hypothetical protein